MAVGKNVERSTFVTLTGSVPLLLRVPLNSQETPVPLPGRFPIWSDLEVSVLLPPPRPDPLGSTSPVPPTPPLTHPGLWRWKSPPAFLVVRSAATQRVSVPFFFFYGRDFSCPAFLPSRRFMGCANFNPGDAAHRSRIFTRVEASCAVAGEGGRKWGGGETSGNIWSKWRGTCMSRLSRVCQVCACKRISGRKI